ncbi:uncharacterized protein LOC143132597 [Alosa pseudoharengus]|uniref:uncharacterized protein LOC143132597 n=1 Tax=Alosa pseudoharengus TaxID=34774 RepID=UPI003F8C754A
MEDQHNLAPASRTDEEAWRERRSNVSRRRLNNDSQIIEGRSTHGLQPAEERNELNEDNKALEEGFTTRQNVHDTDTEHRTMQGQQSSEEEDNNQIELLEEGFSTRQEVLLLLKELMKAFAVILFLMVVGFLVGYSFDATFGIIGTFLGLILGLLFEVLYIGSAGRKEKQAETDRSDNTEKKAISRQEVETLDEKKVEYLEGHASSLSYETEKTKKSKRLIELLAGTVFLTKRIPFDKKSKQKSSSNHHSSVRDDTYSTNVKPANTNHYPALTNLYHQPAYNYSFPTYNNITYSNYTYANHTKPVGLLQ